MNIPAIIVSLGIVLTVAGTVWGVQDFSAAAKRLLVEQDALIAHQAAMLTDAQDALTRTKEENAVLAKFARSVVARQTAVETAP